MRRFKSEYSVAIDIGTTKICVLVAQNNANGCLDIIGIGSHPSHGLKKGVVIDIDATVSSLKQAIEQAQSMSGYTIRQATVGISGSHIESYNSQGVVSIKKHDVSQDDIDRVIDAARAIPLPSDREIIHVLPQYFKIDGQKTGDNSLGMHGTRLETQIHIITGNIASVSNIIKCCELAGISVLDIVLEHIASAEAVLTDSEKELGVGILDIGGGTSDFALYKNGKIKYSKVIPFAGNHFTNDIAICFRIPISQAEKLKRTEGYISLDYTKKALHMIELVLEHTHERKMISSHALSDVLTFRSQEIFELLLHEVLSSNLLSDMRYGLVITGGGGVLQGIDEIAQEIFKIPVRIGMPQNKKENDVMIVVPDGLKSPIYATAFGLLLYARQKNKINFETDATKPLFSKVFKRMKSWIYDFL